MENQMELLMNEMRTINRKLDILMATKKEVVQNDLMNVKEACSFLNLGSSSLYKMTSSNSIPFTKRNGSNKILFSRTALNDWSTNTTSRPYNLKVDEYLHRKLRVRKEQKN